MEVHAPLLLENASEPILNNMAVNPNLSLSKATLVCTIDPHTSQRDQTPRSALPIGFPDLVLDTSASKRGAQNRLRTTAPPTLHRTIHPAGLPPQVSPANKAELSKSIKIGCGSYFGFGDVPTLQPFQVIRPRISAVAGPDPFQVPGPECKLTISQMLNSKCKWMISHSTD